MHLNEMKTYIQIILWKLKIKRLHLDICTEINLM